MTETEKSESVEMPTPTAWPLVFALGIVMMGAGFGIHIGFLVVGLIVFAFGIRGWIGQLIPGHGHSHEAFVSRDDRARPVEPTPGGVEQLVPGTASYRFRVPLTVHPISSGAKGGFVGGIAMAVPAMAYGILDQGSPWLPINLLAGMVVPDLVEASIETLKQFQLGAFIVATVIHLSFSITFGLMYGVILPMLPSFRGSPLIYGGVVMPAIWSGVCYGLMGVVNPALQEHVSWKWFILSQFVYGLAMSYVVFQSEKVAVSQAPPLKGGRV